MKRLFLLSAIMPSLMWGASLHFLTGAETDSSEQSFAYIGIIKDLKIYKSTYISIKLWADYLSYTFNVNTTKVKAEAPSIQAGLGLKFATKYGIFGITPGWETRNTTVSPKVSGIQIQGRTEGAVIVADAYIPLPRNFVFSAVGSYSTSISYTWGRIRVLKGLYFGYFKFGAEAIAQGNYDYESLQFAPLVEYSRSNYSVTLRAGYKNSSAGESIYGGVELYVGF